MRTDISTANTVQLSYGVAKICTLAGLYHEFGWDSSMGVWVRQFNGDREEFSITQTETYNMLVDHYGLVCNHCDTRFLYDKPDHLWRVVNPNGIGYGESDKLGKAVARCVLSTFHSGYFKCPRFLEDRA